MAHVRLRRGSRKITAEPSHALEIILKSWIAAQNGFHWIWGTVPFLHSPY